MFAGRFVGIGAVVLAAGASSRMGTPKQLLRPEGDESLLRRAIRAVLDGGCQPVVVVTGANAELVRVELHDPEVAEVFNNEWAGGLASSIRAGLDGILAAEPELSAAVLLLCDQPFVTPEVIRNLADVYRASGRRVVASTYGGSFGVPALFDRSLFQELAELEGHTGAKQVISRHPADTCFVPFPEGEIDLDTPADFARLTASKFAMQ